MGISGWWQERTKRKELKQQLLAALEKTPRPGGVDLPKYNAERPNDPANAIALRAQVVLEEILREQPVLTVVRFKDKLTLCFREDLQLTMSAELFTEFNQHGVIAQQGTKLTSIIGG